MPRLDDCHPQVVRALEKDGWITTTSYRLFIHKRRAFVDIGATRQINGTREQILLVEVKCFTDRNSTTDELYGAIGQYLIYRTMMVELGMNAPLYLAIPQAVFATLFDR